MKLSLLILICVIQIQHGTEYIRNYRLSCSGIHFITRACTDLKKKMQSVTFALFLNKIKKNAT